MSRVTFGVRGTGSAVPERVLTNDDLSRMVDTSDDWITQRTGIKERRVVPDGQGVTHLATEAARKALEDADLAPAEVDLIVLATVTPDHRVPASACRVQAELGAHRAAAFDVAAGCSGFIYAMSVASQFLRAGSCRNVLVIGGEVLTRITNYADRTSCILFGDAAGAVVLSTEFRHGEFLSSHIEADGRGYEVMIQRAGGALVPATPELIEKGADKLLIRGREVYKFAVNRMVELVQGEMSSNPGLELGAVVPHQVNMRIIEAARERLEIGRERVYVNIERYGNTSSASVPVAFDEACRTGFFDDLSGRLIVMCAFGAGLTWGSVGLRW